MINPQIPPTFKLGPITAVSPSLNETLRNCPLQAALSRVTGIRNFVLGNPKAWLGTAYHYVFEKLWLPTEDDQSIDELVERLWSEAIEELERKASNHPLNRRFASAEKWPGYYLARAFVGIRAHEALSKRPHVRVNTKDRTGSARPMREKQFSAWNGKLIGKPDVVIDNEVHDYKSGTVFDETDEGERIVKEGYIRQLRLYAHLVHETTGRCPTKGKLLPMGGEIVEVDLDPDECALEASEAVARLEDFNNQLNTVSDISDLATPSVAACRWCQFKLLCPAFWKTVDSDWADELGRAAVKGALIEDPKEIHGGHAYAIKVAVLAGTVAEKQVTIAPMDNEIHSVLAGLHSGDEIRVVDVYQRRDGQLAPTASTVCLPANDCSVFELSRG